jgi:hypothetical protein
MTLSFCFVEGGRGLGSKQFWWLEELWVLETLRLGKVPDVLLGQERTILFKGLEGWLLLSLDDMHSRALLNVYAGSTGPQNSDHNF